MYTYVIYLNRLSNIPCSLVLSFPPPVFSSFTYTSSVPPNPPHPKVICVNNLHHNHPCFFPTFIYVCGHGYIYVCGYIYVYMFIYEYIYMFVHTQGSDYFTEVITSHTVFSSLLFSHSTS